MTRQLSLLVVSACAFATLGADAFGDGAVRTITGPANRKTGRAVAILGFSLASQSTFTRTGSTNLSLNSKDPGSIVVGAEVDVDLTPYFSLGGAVSYRPYMNSSSAEAADREVSLLVVPRLLGAAGSVVYWAGLGFGLLHTSVGTDKATSPNWGSSSDSPSSFAWSPRVGVDVDLGNSLLTGGQVIYLSSSGSVTTPSGDKLEFSRHWAEVAAFVGFRY
ncbi:MAG: hypothetical protein HY075_10070 [Deltaproteobacteria bacterium]|nr:hypothetical protein [Deltaproteobacteria bacterium]